MQEHYIAHIVALQRQFFALRGSLMKGTSILVQVMQVLIVLDLAPTLMVNKIILLGQD